MDQRTSKEITELGFSIKLLARTAETTDASVGEVLEKVASVLTTLASQHDDLEEVNHRLEETNKLLATLVQKHETFPTIIAVGIEQMVEKRVFSAFEDIRKTFDEVRNKMWDLRRDFQESTGQHRLPSQMQLAQWEAEASVANKKARGENQEDQGLSINQGDFHMRIPFNEGTRKALKWIGLILLSIVGAGAAGGGVWALVDRIKTALGH